MKNIKSMELIARREAVKTIRNNREIIITAYNDTRTATPTDTVNVLVELIGIETAAEIVAELVNSSGEWDGRISKTVRTWANSIQTAATKDELEMSGVYSGTIHPAHVNEIGYAMMKMCQK